MARVLVGLSGGVDSSAAAALCHAAKSEDARLRTIAVAALALTTGATTHQAAASA